MVEGPPDKVVIVLAGPKGDGARVPDGFAGAAAGHRLGDILDAMRRATSGAMARAGSPVATVRLGDWSEASLGSLLMVFLCATVLGGELLGVNPYGQPGVEHAKVATKQLLADPEGEAARDLAQLLGQGEGLSFPE